MAAHVVADAGFIIALLNHRDEHHAWASAQAERFTPPWQTCDAALSEAFHLLAPRGTTTLCELLRRGALASPFALDDHLKPVLTLLQKYADVPMSLADASLVRMTETLADPILLTTDADFRVYRRHSRQAVPCVLPG